MQKFVTDIKVVLGLIHTIAPVTICSRSSHGTVQYFLMYFTASIHTGGHTPFSIRWERYFDQSVIGVRMERDCQCEHWPQSSYGSAGLEWVSVAVSLCLPRCLPHENIESTGETKARADHEWSKECEYTRIWPYREWSVTWAMVWIKPYACD